MKEATTNAALKLALDALESGVKTTANRISWTEYDCELMEQAITAIKEALALTSTPCEVQPEQEPVAWTVVGDGKFGEYVLGQTFVDYAASHIYWENRGYELVPVYTTPPKRPWGKPWVSLTDDEASWCQAPSTIQTWKRIEAILKEKNT